VSDAVRNILLVDDHAIVCEGYRALLHKQPNLRVVATAADGQTAYLLYKQHQPDLVIIDLAMPGMGGIETVRRIRAWDPAARLLVLTMHQGASFALQAFRAGARGYVTKSSPPDILVRAVFEVLAGKTALSADIGQALALNRLGETRAAADLLSPREFEILRLLLTGLSSDQIAETLHVSAKTVANTRTLIKGKLGVASDIDLVRLALEQGLIAGVPLTT